MSLDLASLDRDFEEAMAGATRKRQGGEGCATGKLPALATLTPKINNGFFTLTLPDGSHRTFRIHTQNAEAKFCPGRRMVGMLIGPDNTADYEGCAFVEESGFVPWKRFRGTKQEMYLGILWEIVVEGKEVAGCEVMESKRCLVCNRTLTDDLSISRGIGPTCWERVGGGAG